MSVIDSKISPLSDEFKINVSAMEQAIAEFRDIELGLESSAQAKKEKYAARGMLLPRERLARLIDPGSPFIELSSLAGYKMYDDKDGSGAGGGCIAGIASVSGVRCIVRVDNFAVKGGTISPIGMGKALRMQQIAMENKLPIVSLAQSGGANLAYASETFAPGGRGFANQARMSAAGLPQITVVHGSATAGGAYQPGLSDYVIMVRNQATMYLAGPPLLKAATGEVATDEDLGGAQMHTGVAGTAEYLAEDDADGIRIAREVMATIPWQRQNSADQPLHFEEPLDFEEPLYPCEQLTGVVPADSKKPYDVREILARVADGSKFFDFKLQYDQQTVCGHIAIEGHTCGVIGNNGPITTLGATKAAQFIQLCEQSGIPILFLHNTTGFMVGTDAEHNGIIKHGSKLIQAVANARVPKLSIVVGGSYGAGNYAMCGRGFDPRFIFAWPNSRTAVMGGAQAGQVLRIVTEASMKRSGKVDEQALDQLEQQTAAMLDAQATATACSARLWDDGLIDPRDTRRLLAMLLSICRDADKRELRSNTFGVGRF
jgi:geranyl-CoA carboxylase beta subunit